MVPTFRMKSVSVLAMLWSSPLLAAQCYAPSDPVRLTPDEQRAVVLTIRDNPDVFQSDFGSSGR
jgi:Sec-independent protein secretion pathway component TatC